MQRCSFKWMISGDDGLQKDLILDAKMLTALSSDFAVTNLEHFLSSWLTNWIMLHNILHSITTLNHRYIWKLLEAPWTKPLSKLRQLNFWTLTQMFLWQCCADVIVMCLYLEMVGAKWSQFSSNNISNYCRGLL